MAVSKFHREVRDFLDRELPEGWKAKGWPEEEVNLCHLTGSSGARFADFYVENTRDGRAFVIEVHSTLHNSDGIGAWGGNEDDHHIRIGNDDHKLQVCVDLGIHLYPVWPILKEEDLLHVMKIAIRESCVPDVVKKSDQKSTSIGNQGVSWDVRPMMTKPVEWKPKSNAFSNGQKLRSGSSFAKGESFGRRNT